MRFRYSRTIKGGLRNFGGGHIQTTPPATGAQLEDEREYWGAVRAA